MVKSSNPTNLIQIPCKPSISGPAPTNLKLAPFRVWSLCCKSLLINDFITFSKLDLLFLTETWLDDNTRNLILIESTLPYQFESEARQDKNGWEVCAYLRDVLLFKKI